MDDITRWALLGLDAEIARLNDERTRLMGGKLEAPTRARKGRRPMSAAKRRAQSKRMKAVWAAKRAASAQSPKGGRK